MMKTITPGFVSLALILSILLTSVVNGQTTALVGNRNISQQSETKFENSAYLEDLSQLAEEGKIQLTEGLENEVEKVENILASGAKDKKGTIVFDKYGSKRLAVIDNLALRLANETGLKNLRGMKLLKINLAQLVGGAADEKEIIAQLDGVLKTIEKIKDKTIVIVEEAYYKKK